MIHKKWVLRDVVKKFILIFIICFFGVLITGCGVWKAHRNIKNLNELKLGMTRGEVLNLMGAPSKSMSFEGGEGRAVEILFYLISMNRDYTPLVLVDGVLNGWGVDYYKQRLLSTEGPKDQP